VKKLRGKEAGKRMEIAPCYLLRYLSESAAYHLLESQGGEKEIGDSPRYFRGFHVLNGFCLTLLLSYPIKPSGNKSDRASFLRALKAMRNI